MFKMTICCLMACSVRGRFLHWSAAALTTLWLQDAYSSVNEVLRVVGVKEGCLLPNFAPLAPTRRNCRVSSRRRCELCPWQSATGRVNTLQDSVRLSPIQFTPPDETKHRHQSTHSVVSRVSRPDCLVATDLAIWILLCPDAATYWSVSQARCTGALSCTPRPDKKCPIQCLQWLCQILTDLDIWWKCRLVNVQ